MEEQKGQPNNPLHGVKLADILEFLVEKYGWKEMSLQVDINCFKKKIFLDKVRLIITKILNLINLTNICEEIL